MTCKNYAHIRPLYEIMLLCSHQETALHHHRKGEELRIGKSVILALCDPVINETKDCSKKEELAIVIHYVDVEAENILFENLRTFSEVTTLDS